MIEKWRVFGWLAQFQVLMIDSKRPECMKTFAITTARCVHKMKTIATTNIEIVSDQCNLGKWHLKYVEPIGALCQTLEEKR